MIRRLPLLCILCALCVSTFFARGLFSAPRAKTLPPGEWSAADFAPSRDFVERPYGLRSYNGMARCARWTLERLNKHSARGDRTGLSFHADPATPHEFAVSPADYHASGYDIGHFPAAGNHGQRPDELKSTFAFENACPQTPELNRGPWRTVEDYLFDFAHADGVQDIWVLTGSAWICDDETAPAAAIAVKTIGPHHVWVPTHCLKSALIVFEDGQVDHRTWCFANTSKPQASKEARCTIDQAETFLGLDLWSALPDPLETELEARK